MKEVPQIVKGIEPIRSKILKQSQQQLNNRLNNVFDEVYGNPQTNTRRQPNPIRQASPNPNIVNQQHRDQGINLNNASTKEVYAKSQRSNQQLASQRGMIQSPNNKYNQPFVYNTKPQTQQQRGNPQNQQVPVNPNQQPFAYSNRRSPSPSNQSFQNQRGNAPVNQQKIVILASEKQPFTYSNRRSPSPSQQDMRSSNVGQRRNPTSNVNVQGNVDNRTSIGQRNPSNSNQTENNQQPFTYSQRLSPSPQPMKNPVYLVQNNQQERVYSNRQSQSPQPRQNTQPVQSNQNIVNKPFTYSNRQSQSPQPRESPHPGQSNLSIVNKPFTYSNRQSVTPIEQEIAINVGDEHSNPMTVDISSKRVNNQQGNVNVKSPQPFTQKEPITIQQRAPSQEEAKHNKKRIEKSPSQPLMNTTNNKPFTYSNRLSPHRNNQFKEALQLDISDEHDRSVRSNPLSVDIKSPRSNANNQHRNTKTSTGVLTAKIEDNRSDLSQNNQVVLNLDSFRERRTTKIKLDELMKTLEINVNRIKFEKDKQALHDILMTNKAQIRDFIVEQNGKLSDYEIVLAKQEKEIYELKKQKTPIITNPKLLETLKADLLSTIQKYNKLVDRYNTLKSAKGLDTSDIDEVKNKAIENLRQYNAKQDEQLKLIEQENTILREEIEQLKKATPSGNEALELINLKKEYSEMKEKSEQQRTELIKLNEDHQRVLNEKQKTIQLMKDHQNNYKRFKFENLILKKRMQEICDKTGEKFIDPTQQDDYKIEYNAFVSEFDEDNNKYNRLAQSELTETDQSMGDNLIGVLDYKFKVS